MSNKYPEKVAAELESNYATTVLRKGALVGAVGAGAYLGLRNKIQSPGTSRNSF